MNYLVVSFKSYYPKFFNYKYIHHFKFILYFHILNPTFDFSSITMLKIYLTNFIIHLIKFYCYFITINNRINYYYLNKHLIILNIILKTQIRTRLKFFVKIGAIIHYFIVS